MGVEKHVEEEITIEETERRLKILEGDFHRELSWGFSDKIAMRRYPIYSGEGFSSDRNIGTALVREWNIKNESEFLYNNRASRFKKISGGIYLSDLDISIANDFVKQIHDLHFLRDLKPSDDIFKSENLERFHKHLASKENSEGVKPFINAYLQSRSYIYTGRKI